MNPTDPTNVLSELETTPAAPTTSTPSNYPQMLSQGSNVLNQLQNQPQQVPTQGKTPNFFERILPTAGSILGGLAGGALDIGTGGLALAVDPALAGLGGSLGKAAENALTGQKVIQGSDLTSGAEGAIGQGVGMGIGSLLGKGGSVLSDLGANKLASQEAQAGTQAAEDEATRVGNEFGAVKPGMAQVGPALEKARSLGITNPTAQDLVNVGNIYTGSNPETGTGVLNFYKQQALDQAGGTVDVNNVMDNLHNTLATPENQLNLGSEEPVTSSRGQLPKAPANVATKIVQQVRNMLPGDTLDESGQLTQQLSPKEGFNLLKTVGGKIEETAPKVNANTGQYDPAQVAENQVWRSVYNDVKGAVYNRPEVDSAIQGLRVGPDESAVIDDAIKSNGITDPQVAANIKADLSNTLNNASSAQELLSAEAPMVNVSKVGNIATKDLENNPQLARNVKAAKSQINTSAPAPRDLLGTGLDLGGAYEGLLKGHPAALIPAFGYNMLKSPAALSSVGNVLSKVGASELPTVASQLVAGSPNAVVPGGGTINTMDNYSSMNSPLSSAIGQSLEYPFMPGSSSTLAAILPLAQKLADFESAQQNQQAAFNASGGAQGPASGILSRLGQTLTNGPGSLLNGTLGRDTAAETAAAQQLGISQLPTPQITQSQPTAQLNSQNAVNGILSLLNLLESPTPATAQ